MSVGLLLPINLQASWLICWIINEIRSRDLGKLVNLGLMFFKANNSFLLCFFIILLAPCHEEKKEQKNTLA